ncbi:MAG: GAF domain-containing protein [Candidatus Brocadiae bacterium]|nr:GAF domain-containing protein [Candidatus Brocadiia bacterium]
MSLHSRGIFQAKFVYVVSVLVVSLGVVSLMWRFKDVDWILTVYGLALVLVVTAFAWEIATRAERLDEIVKARTDALAESNRYLSALLEQLNAFHTISYEITQRMDLDEITSEFPERLYGLLPDVDGVWLWLDRRSLGAEVAASNPEESLELVAQAGEDLGAPPELQGLRAGNPLVAACFDEHRVSICRDLPGEASAWGWDWLAGSGLRSFAGCPLEVGERMLGILGVFSRSDMSTGFISQIKLSVNHLAVALEKARLLEETQERAEALAAANEELRQLDAMKDWFVSAVSHELRTPLTSIRSFGEILEHYQDLEPHEREEFAAIIRQESERLSEMIDNMLDLAKIAAGKGAFHPRSFHLPLLVERCCKLFWQEAEERAMEFGHAVPEGLPQVYADEEGVARVLTNLIGNAFKFTQDGGKIEVSAELAERGSGDRELVTVLVSDTGVGIAPEDQPRIFDRFTQVGTDLTGKPGGVGIGLAICREIVQSSNGEIWVRSVPGKGSTFNFTLPTRPSP